jgi:hypothetical protein
MSIWLKLINAIGVKKHDELKAGDGATTLQNSMNEHTARSMIETHQ